jgi:hypothetical protein
MSSTKQTNMSRKSKTEIWGIKSVKEEEMNNGMLVKLLITSSCCKKKLSKNAKYA